MQKTAVAIETQGFALVTSGRRRESLTVSILSCTCMYNYKYVYLYNYCTCKYWYLCIVNVSLSSFLPPVAYYKKTFKGPRSR